MEHRWHKRSSVDWETEVRIGKQTVTHCRITNISREGLFVQGRFSQLAKGSVVQIHCVSPAADIDTPILGLVVHSSSRGLGVLLVETRAEQRTGSWYLVRAA